MLVTKQQKKEWGSYDDRENSYDDISDFNHFIKHTKTNCELQKYLLQYIPKNIRDNVEWKFKPDGDYGIDLALINKDTNKKILCVDLERWSEWNGQWPYWYRFIHYLGRKDHFLKMQESFIIVFFEYNRNKLLICEKETIKKYTTFQKYFKVKKCHDMVKEMKMSDGYVFGNNLTDIEKRNFKIYGEKI